MQIQRTTLLSFYISLINITLFIIHLVIFIRVIGSLKSGEFAYADHFHLLCLGTALQLLDTLHGFLGFTSTHVAISILQVFGRLTMLFIINGNASIHEQITTPVLFFAWVSIELFRYPYYALRAWKVDIYPLTWLRYSAWIPLYPLGLSMEWISLASSLKYYYETGKYSFSLPGLGTLNFGIVIGALVVALPLIGRTLMMHMRKQRMSKLHSKKLE